MIRHATMEDASRIAEILIFTKRINYRNIFNNDRVSFGEMQVYPLAKEYIDNPNKLESIWVCIYRRKTIGRRYNRICCSNETIDQNLTVSFTLL